MRLVQHGLLWVVVFVVAGCAGQSNEAAGPTSDQNGESAEVAIDGTLEGEETVAFNDPLPIPETLPEGEVVPILLPPTSPDQRAAQVVTGRPDPFAPVSSGAPTLVPSSSARPQPAPPPATPLQTIPVASLPNLPPAPIATLPLQVPGSNPGEVPTVPSPSAPTVAVVPAVQAVEVSGVVDLGGTARAIVSVPNESRGQSVSVGDRIANGQVLVKRIDVGRGGDPIVVLEQNGIEVVRSVSLRGG